MRPSWSSVPIIHPSPSGSHRTWAQEQTFMLTLTTKPATAASTPPMAYARTGSNPSRYTPRL